MQGAGAHLAQQVQLQMDGAVVVRLTGQHRIEIGVRLFLPFRVGAAQQRQHVQMAGHAGEWRLALAAFAPQQLQRAIETGQRCGVLAAQQGDAAGERLRQRVIRVLLQPQRRSIELAAQGQVLGQRQRQNAGRRVAPAARFCGGAQRRCAALFAWRMVQQDRQHAILQQWMDVGDQFRLERTHADVDQRMQLRRFVASQARFQQRQHLLRRIAAQQGDAQARQALTVTAQFDAAIPAVAHRVDRFHRAAQVAEHVGVQRRAQRRPAQPGAAQVAAPDHFADQG